MERQSRRSIEKGWQRREFIDDCRSCRHLLVDIIERGGQIVQKTAEMPRLTK